MEYDFSKMSDEEFQSTIDGFTSDQLYEALNYVWQNYWISDVFEPGSTYKAFTKMCIRDSLEDGKLAKTIEVADEDEQAWIEEYNLLTWKPVIFAANVGEEDKMCIRDSSSGV